MRRLGIRRFEILFFFFFFPPAGQELKEAVEVICSGEPDQEHHIVQHVRLWGGKTFVCSCFECPVLYTCSTFSTRHPFLLRKQKE